MPSGHSRCWNDLFMGVFKKKFRNCDINSLKDIYQIAQRCTGPSNSISPVLVGNDNGDIEFPLLDWNDKFSQINNLDASILLSNNHFEISNEVPGLVLCRRLVNSDTISYALIASEDLDSISGDLPESLEIEGMSAERKKYLYDNIREFTPTKFQPLICPHPDSEVLTSVFGTNEDIEDITPPVSTFLAVFCQFYFNGFCFCRQKKNIFTTKNSNKKINASLKIKYCSTIHNWFLSIITHVPCTSQFLK